MTVHCIFYSYRGILLGVSYVRFLTIELTVTVSETDFIMKFSYVSYFCVLERTDWLVI